MKSAPKYPRLHASVRGWRHAPLCVLRYGCVLLSYEYVVQGMKHSRFSRLKTAQCRILPCLRARPHSPTQLILLP